MAVADECFNAKSPPSSSTPSASLSATPCNRGHYLSKCVLRGSAVLQVVYGHIRYPSTDDVIFGKETSIELAEIGKDGMLTSVCEQPVFGIITDLAIVPWNQDFRSRPPQHMLGKDLLAVVSDSGKLSFLTFCNELHRFLPLTHVHLSNPGNSRHHLGRILSVDSSGCFIATSAHVDRLALYSLSRSSGDELIHKAISYPFEGDGNSSFAKSVRRHSISGTIWSMCFISRDSSLPIKEQNPALAIILNRRGSLLNELVLLEWDVKEDAVNIASTFVEVGPLAYDIVEVPKYHGFAFLFRIGDALLMDLRDIRNPCCIFRTSLNFLPQIVEEQNAVEDSYRAYDIDDDVAARALLQLGDYDPMCIDGESGSAFANSYRICSWSWEPGWEKNPRMIFSLNNGDLYIAEISLDSDGFKVNFSDCLYKGLPCKVILWAKSAYVAAIVEMGDGIILKLENGKLVDCSSIQNVAPIMDMSVLNFQDEKGTHVFACSGVAPEGSLRIIRSGVSIEKLLMTAPIYQGITGTWTMRMKASDSYHSLLVLSFVEETRVLSVGLNFTDVTDSVGFRSDVCTLACGLVVDGLLVQIHQGAVELCEPIHIPHQQYVTLPSPVRSSWFPENQSISLGAVKHNLVVVSTSNPCSLYILGINYHSSSNYRLFQMQRVGLLHELSCIFVPQNIVSSGESTRRLKESCLSASLPAGLEINNLLVIGTHRPSVEVLSFEPKRGLKVLASGIISLKNTLGTAMSGCIPQDVRLVLVDRLYVLSALRNGMLLRYEWPSAVTLSSTDILNCGCHIGSLAAHGHNLTGSLPVASQPHSLDLIYDEIDGLPTKLELIAKRCIGITPVFLVPLNDSLECDIVVLSDRPWLLHTARHSLSYTAVSFQSSTHATPVCVPECPDGLLFVADNSLHLVEMVYGKRLNVLKFLLGGTPRKVLYHKESKLLLVMRTNMSDDTSSSDICCVNPFNGSIISSFKLEVGETGKSMELVRVANEEVLVVGTSLSSGPSIMPSGEAESSKGRLLVLCLEHVLNSVTGSISFTRRSSSSLNRTTPFNETGGMVEQLSGSSNCSSPDDISNDGDRVEESEIWQLRLASAAPWPGMVLAICPYLERYFLASAGNAFYMCSFANDTPQRIRKLAVGRTRFMITALVSNATRIAVGDCRDGILFYSYHEDTRKLEQLHCDPSQRLVADVSLIDVNTVVVSDRKGSIAFLSASDCAEGSANPESNLVLNCAYHLGEISMSIRKVSLCHKLPADQVWSENDGAVTSIDAANQTVMASTLLGSILIFLPLSRYEHEILDVVQARLMEHPLTAPILGNDINEFRGRENQKGIPKILDGDMLAQFLELTTAQQTAVLASRPPRLHASKIAKLPLYRHISVSQVVQLLERVHYALS